MARRSGPPDRASQRPAGGLPGRLPAGPPPSGPPEVLESGGGGPLPPTPPHGRSGGGRRKGLVIGGVVGVLAIGGAAFGAYSWLSGTGAQPAEALPAETLGYLSVDLDPSGSQKIAALTTLRKFPAFKDEIGLDTDDDLREKIVEEALKDAPCDDLDYADDFEPWLGDRFAVAAIAQGGDETPAPVFVAQIKDAGKAEDGLEAIQECGGEESGDDLGGWSISGDWVVVAETDEIAEQVTDDAAEGSLADDADFQSWTGDGRRPGHHLGLRLARRGCGDRQAADRAGWARWRAGRRDPGRRRSAPTASSSTRSPSPRSSRPAWRASSTRRRPPEWPPTTAPSTRTPSTRRWPRCWRTSRAPA